MASLRVVSEIAIVPESECRTPTLIVSSACAAIELSNTTAADAILATLRVTELNEVISYPFWWTPTFEAATSVPPEGLAKFIQFSPAVMMSPRNSIGTESLCLVLRH